VRDGGTLAFSLRRTSSQLRHARTQRLLLLRPRLRRRRRRSSGARLDSNHVPGRGEAPPLPQGSALTLLPPFVLAHLEFSIH
jgi:hypothetical protein